MIRTIFWIIFHVITLGLFDLELKYSDGLTIKLNRGRVWKR